MVRRLFLVLLVATATSCERMPYEVPLPNTVMASASGAHVHRCGEIALAPLSVRAGLYPASDVLLSPSRTLVLAELPSGERWVETPSPMSEEDEAVLLGLEGRSEECPFVAVEPFADGKHVIATTEDGTMAVQLSSRRARMLDHRSASLENCRMTRDRSILECSLDLEWEMARFDRDGNELDGTFEPAWIWDRQ